MPPRVTVLIPSFNAAPWVATAVESVRAQTFEDWEIVAVDDASTDETARILESFSGARVRVERNAQNLGMTANWNRCLSLASGDLVLKLDADDALHARALERLVSAFDDPQIAAAGVRSLQCDEGLQPFDGIQGDDVMQRAGINPYRDTVQAAQWWYDVAAMGFQLWSSSAFMIRRDVIDSLRGWDERFGCASDSELIWRTMELGRPIAHRGAVGAYYRVRPGSISDEYRSQGWLTWEATAANLLSLHRVRKKRPLRRSLRMHYVRLWQRWRDSRERGRNLPPAIAASLADVIAEVSPPPIADTVLTRVRDAVAPT